VTCLQRFGRAELILSTDAAERSGAALLEIGSRPSRVAAWSLRSYRSQLPPV
jgi:hypothetical protein